MAALLAFAGCADASDASKLPMSDDELTGLYLGVVEDAVDVFDPLWTDASGQIPRSGFLDFRGYGDWSPDFPGYASVITVPGNGMIGFCYAVLLTETERASFGKKRITRAELCERLVRLLRWCALTSAYVEKPYPFLSDSTDPQFLQGQQWRRPWGFRADEIGYLTLAAAKIWPQLDPETRSLLEAMMVGGAVRERIKRWWYPPQGGNHDRVKQDLSSTIGAAFLFPGRADAALFRDLVRDQGLDMVSTLHDFANPALAGGRPVSERAQVWNLYPDHTSDHHGWAQIWYGADKLFEGRLYVEMLSRWTGVPVPETFTYPGNGYDGILERMKILALPDGEPISVHGAEYDSYYGAGVLVYAYGAVLKGDAVASALEERAAVLLRNHSRALPKYDYHRNNWGKAALALLLHRAGSRAEPLALPAAWQQLAGTFHHPWQRNLLHRDERKMASFAWGSISSRGQHFGGEGSGFCGFVVPNRGLDAAAPPLVYLHPRSLTGVLTVTTSDGTTWRQPQPATLYQFARDDAGFHTTGIVPLGPVEQTCAFFSFPAGPAILLNSLRTAADCRISWSGVPVYFFVREGLTPARTFSTAAGSSTMDGRRVKCSSRWWAVDDAIGVVVCDGDGVIERVREVGRNWARSESYRDRCDKVAVSPLEDHALKTDERAGRVVAVIYSNMRNAELPVLNAGVQNLGGVLPDGWSGVVAPLEVSSHRRCLAIANLDGLVTVTTLNLTFPEGAPVLAGDTFVTGKNARTMLELSRLDAMRQQLDVYVEALNEQSVIARQVASDRYVVLPAGGASTKVIVRAFGRGGKTVAVRRWGQSVHAPALLRFEAEATIDVGEGVELVVEGTRELDRTGPAVEIASAEVREDGQVCVTVEAHDQSGMAYVELFHDGKSLGRKQSGPFVWVSWPKPGYHRFNAVAEDAAAAANRRLSDSRTVFVPAIAVPKD